MSLDPQDQDDQARAIIQEAHREERRVRMTLEDLRQDGPPVRLRDLVGITGLSKSKFLEEVKAGRLKATRVRTGQTWRAAVEREEAYRYLVELGFVA